MAVLLAACASVPPPDNLMARAQQQLKVATQAGASDYAPVDLDFARRRFQDAQTAVDAQKYASAQNLANESLADGRLAEVRARLAKTRHEINKQKAENARLQVKLLGASASQPTNSGLPEEVTLPEASTPDSPASAPASASSTDGGNP